VASSETLVETQRTTRHHISEDDTLVLVRFSKLFLLFYIFCGIYSFSYLCLNSIIRIFCTLSSWNRMLYFIILLFPFVLHLAWFFPQNIFFFFLGGGLLVDICKLNSFAVSSGWVVTICGFLCLTKCCPIHGFDWLKWSLTKWEMFWCLSFFLLTHFIYVTFFLQIKKSNWRQSLLWHEGN
jgi:hypothetical protein